MKQENEVVQLRNAYDNFKMIRRVVGVMGHTNGLLKYDDLHGTYTFIRLT
jgi:hypothetical protein